MTGKQQKRTEPVGTLVVEATEVVRPDGTRVTVEGGFYVLDVPGTFTVDGSEVVAK